MACKCKTEVYSRIVGYYRPVQQWNKGKKAEYFKRKTYVVSSAPAACMDDTKDKAVDVA